MAFLKALFSCASKARKWISLDMTAAMEKTGHSREVILRAMESLQEKQLITLQMSGYRQRFTCLKPEVDRENLCQQLHRRFAQHEQQEIGRIQSMLDYVQEPSCLSRHLLAYFGETIEPCGHCGVCMGESPAKLTQRQAIEVPQELLTELMQLAQQYPTALESARQQARFLCGLSSPATSAERALRGHALFGCCSQTPFQLLLKQLQSV